MKFNGNRDLFSGMGSCGFHSFVLFPSSHQNIKQMGGEPSILSTVATIPLCNCAGRSSNQQRLFNKSEHLSPERLLTRCSLLGFERQI